MEYRLAVPSSRGDVCLDAEDGLSWGTSDGTVRRVQELCSESSVLWPLGWVFLGTGVAALATGVVLLLVDDDPAEENRVTLLPRFDTTGAALDATVRF